MSETAVDTPSTLPEKLIEIKKQLIEQVRQLDPKNGWTKHVDKAKLCLIKKNTGGRGVVWFKEGDLCLAILKKYVDANGKEVSREYTFFSWHSVWNINHGPMPESLKNSVIGWCGLSKSAKFLVLE